ncbi:hypothetical protein ACFP81_05970 [Deinococcus lacus]|uniref:Heparan-alpha-glucosaminide N-acetyltransferase catalytic domain-containing protein n=1 Tax=Deinococcus lacus TaxID=392561 RepID=A0ABW1YEJ4_9DEIO
MSLSSQPNPAASALAVQERALLPDALRGFALLGILLINVQDFAGFQVWTQAGLDRGVQILTDIFFNGRSISLFALLFGWGPLASTGGTDWVSICGGISCCW